MGCSTEFRIVPQDRALEFPESRARLDPQLLAQGGSSFAVDLQSFCLPTSPVERCHVAPERELGVDPILHRRKPKLLEPLSLWARECFVCQIGESRPAPELERRSKTLGGGSWIIVIQELPPFACEAGEPVRIELVLPDVKGIARRL